ncbi:hypothetical protein [Burkholderia cepacia]|uniref:hypothetical protein n=1 Tax=Burkholderia cepacia TaxID=292 RepID=UPI003B51FB36
MKVEHHPAVAFHHALHEQVAKCAYLVSWQLAVENFLGVLANIGEHLRVTLHMNTVNWIPDLFMKRLVDRADWCLFSPSTCPDLLDTCRSCP